MRLRLYTESATALKARMAADDLKLIAAVLGYVFSDGARRGYSMSVFERDLREVDLGRVSKELKMKLPARITVSRWHGLSNAEIDAVKADFSAGKKHVLGYAPISFSKGTIDKHFQKAASHGMITQHELSEMSGWCVPTYLILKWASRLQNFKAYVAGLLERRMYTQIDVLERAGLLEHHAVRGHYEMDDVRSIEFYEEDITRGMADYSRRQREIMVFSKGTAVLDPKDPHLFVGRNG